MILFNINNISSQNLIYLQNAVSLQLKKLICNTWQL